MRVSQLASESGYVTIRSSILASVIEKLHPDYKHQGLATFEDIKIGAKLWVVHQGSTKPQMITVLTYPMDTRALHQATGFNGNFDYQEWDGEKRWVLILGEKGDSWTHISLKDFGMCGKPYSLNRLLTSEESAQSYIEKSEIYHAITGKRA